MCPGATCSARAPSWVARSSGRRRPCSRSPARPSRRGEPRWSGDLRLLRRVARHPGHGLHLFGRRGPTPWVDRLPEEQRDGPELPAGPGGCLRPGLTAMNGQLGRQAQRQGRPPTSRASPSAAATAASRCRRAATARRHRTRWSSRRASRAARTGRTRGSRTCRSSSASPRPLGTAADSSRAGRLVARPCCCLGSRRRVQAVRRRDDRSTVASMRRTASSREPTCRV